MQKLSSSVGAGGANTRHDTALVQARLRLAQRPLQLDPLRSPYLRTIDGDCGALTLVALRQFQSDQVFVAPDGRSSQVVAGATAGRIDPDDQSWKKLVAATPAEMTDLRVLDGGITVFLAAPTHELSSAIAAASAMTFEPLFRAHLLALMQRIHEQTGIAVKVCRDGARRSFQTQYGLLMGKRHVTDAGPGESNHNFGQAADLGFDGLRWLRRDGSLVDDEDAWLRKLDPKEHAVGEAGLFWALLRTHGLALGLYRGPMRDHPHLQAWPDAHVDMASRLADLLNRVGKLRWSGHKGHYECDLGLGGKLFKVGSAAQIWNREAAVTVAMVNEARAARPVPALISNVADRPPAPVPATEADATALKAALRADFDAADSQWASWRSK